MKEFKTILVDIASTGVCTIQVNRPEALNALNSQVLSELAAALREINHNSSVRVIVLTGAGDKAFIAGADIVEMKDKTTGEATEFSQLGHDVAQLLEHSPQPTLAAVNGFALGGGAEMAIACDFIVASDNAVFGQPEVGLGVIPGFGATFRLARTIGFPKAKELMFSGRRIRADEAFALGLVNHVWSQEEFRQKWTELAEQIAKNSSGAVQKCKTLMNEFMESSGLSHKIDAEAHAFGRLFGTKDQREGMNAFVEKRKPVFEGTQK